MPRPKIPIEERKGKVYKITSPKGRVYIGSTYQHINARWGKYKNLDCKEQIRLYRSLLKYKPEAHLFEVIWEGPVEEMFKMEHLLGLQHNCFDGKTGMNCTLPGYGDVPGLVSDRTREKLSTSNKGRVIPARTAEQRKRYSEALKNSVNKFCRKGCTQDSSKSKKAVVCYDLAGNFLREFNSLKEASEHTRCSKSMVSKCCYNSDYSCKGYKFSFKYQLFYPGVYQIDPLSGVIIKEWPSAKEASKKLGISSSGINRCANGKCISSYGYFWKFVDSNYKSYTLTKTGAQDKLNRKRMSPEARKNISMSNYKPINLYTRDGIFYRSFPSCKDAALFLEVGTSCIAIVLKKGKGTIKGYQLRYRLCEHNTNIEPDLIEGYRNRSKVNLVDESGIILKTFPTVSEAAKYINKTASCVSDVCKKQGVTRCGCRFRYA